MSAQIEEDQTLDTIDRSEVTAPSCLKQLTVFVAHREEIAFAIRQLDAYDAPWKLKQAPTGRVAVFVPGTRRTRGGA